MLYSDSSTNDYVRSPPTHRKTQQAINKSGVVRDDLFLTTKLWDEDLSGDRVASAVDRFLQELNVEYVDLLLIH